MVSSFLSLATDQHPTGDKFLISTYFETSNPNFFFDAGYSNVLKQSLTYEYLNHELLERRDSDLDVHDRVAILVDEQNLDDRFRPLEVLKVG